MLAIIFIQVLPEIISKVRAVNTLWNLLLWQKCLPKSTNKGMLPTNLSLSYTFR